MMLRSRIKSCQIFDNSERTGSIIWSSAGVWANVEETTCPTVELRSVGTEGGIVAADVNVDSDVGNSFPSITACRANDRLG